MRERTQGGSDVSGGIFLDRDGVLCENRADYVKTWSEFKWIPGALDALRMLAELELPIIMVTNQSAVNRGLTTLEDVRDIHARMAADVRQAGGRVDAIYVCPHRPDEGCGCRKPGVLLFQTAAQDLAVALERSYLIGDNLTDLEVGWALGLQVILVRTGLGTGTADRIRGDGRQVLVLPDVADAARWISAHRRPDLAAGTMRARPGRTVRV